jgi:predicted acyltransferase
MNEFEPTGSLGKRLLSLDLFRGLTMFLLIAEGRRFYVALNAMISSDSIFSGLIKNFYHHEWNGLYFWDLIQPFFMFIVGVAMVYSLQKRWDSGDTWNQSFKHILRRCLILFLFGVILHCGWKKALVWELWNVLTQLSFTILLAFLIFRFSLINQFIVSLGLLILTELAYRLLPVAGFDQPFVMGHNFGSWMDLVLMGKINPKGWVAINCIPTAAHTIWGVIIGKILMSKRSEMEKVKIIAIFGLIGIAVGYGMDWTGITPIIKRISTSSFVIVSGGWAFLAMAFFYWLIDIKGYKRWTLFFTIVGMNSIFIYMFNGTIGGQWLNGYMMIYTDGLFSIFGASAGIVKLINALIVLGIEWYLCYWLYKRKIFFRI